MARETQGYAGYRGATEREPGCLSLPPDVEPQPLPVAEALLRWLDARHIAAGDRGAASQGIRLGALLGEWMLAFRRWRDRRLARPPLQPRPQVVAPRLPPIRRSPFHRRARPLPLKRSFQR